VLLLFGSGLPAMAFMQVRTRPTACTLTEPHTESCSPCTHGDHVMPFQLNTVPCCATQRWQGLWGEVVFNRCGGTLRYALAAHRAMSAEAHTGCWRPT
jgi:hypothetical protein